MKPCVVGVDLGGTNLRAAAVSADGAVLAEAAVETRAAEGPDAVVERIVALIGRVGEEASVRPLGVGVGIPGPVGPDAGVVATAPNLPGWHRVPLGAILGTRLGIPVAVENDANAAAAGEAWLGAGAGARALVFLTLGTGVGGGIVLDGRLWRGTSGSAGEVGHMVVVPDGPACGCGARGCVEQFASATAIARRAREMAIRGDAPAILKRAGGDPAAITSRFVHEAAMEGDRPARRLLEEAGRMLGVALAGVVNLLNPDRIAVGGAVAGSWDILGPAIEEEVRLRAFAVARAHLAIVPAALGGRAGVLGAARCALTALG